MKRFSILALCLMAACGRNIPDEARIVVAGDSIMSWNRGEGASVADVLQTRLREPIGDVSLSLAQITGGIRPLNIPNQLDGVRAEWIVLDGGGNDLSRNCNCSDCDVVLDALISENGRQGEIPALVADLRERGSRVVWADYYTAPLYAGTTCEAPYQVLQNRLTRMAAADAGVVFVDMDDVFSATDLSLFDADRLHPSKAGSVLIADLIAPHVRRSAQ